MDAITYQCWGKTLSMLIKGALILIYTSYSMEASSFNTHLIILLSLWYDSNAKHLLDHIHEKIQEVQG